MRRIFFPIIALLFAVASCGNDGKEELSATVDSFSVAYFNWQFRRALPYADAASARWLSYAASQVGEDDVDSLRAMEQGAETEITNLQIHDGDSTAVATVRVRNFLAMDSIGEAPHVEQNKTFRLSVARRGGKWKVVLDGLPR